MRSLLLFGASGAIGGAVAKRFSSEGYSVSSVGRSLAKDCDRDYFQWSGNETDIGGFIERLSESPPFDAICWAQGTNLNDDILTVAIDAHREIYRSNVEYIILSLQALLNQGLVKDGARLCVISSIWQNVTRNNKFSYGITKSALQSLVLSLSADLAKNNILINAVLPGAIDTPMTRQNLTEEQISNITNQTDHGRLVNLEDIANAVWMLNSPNNTAVTGNFLTVDLGFSYVKKV